MLDYPGLIDNALEELYIQLPATNGQLDRHMQLYYINNAVKGVAEKRVELLKKQIMPTIPTGLGKHIVQDSTFVFSECNNIAVAKPINNDLLVAALIKRGISVGDIQTIIDEARPPAGIQQRFTVTLKQ